MTDDLSTRLLAAIEKAKAAVDQYVAHRAGTGGPCLNYEGQDPEDYIDCDSCRVHIQTSEATPYRDVEFGLRRCEGDRLSVERHHPMTTPPWETKCFHCCEEWPCPDLVDLAYVYRIEVAS